MNIPETTSHQISFYFPTSPNVCFWTTLGKTEPTKYYFYPMRYDYL